MNFYVVKIGGSTWGEPRNGDAPESVNLISAKLRDMAATGTVIPVVSAFKGVTDSLLRKIASIKKNDHLSRAEKSAYAAYASGGETEAATLLALALNARSFQGWQVPFITHGDPDRAEIDLAASGAKLIKHMRAGNRMAVVAGFQGLDKDENIPTAFARGGTDYSAIAAAIILQNSFAEAGDQVTCQIVRNEGGVRTADPKLVDNTAIHSRLSYDELYAVSVAGGGQQLIQTDAMKLARQYGVSLSIGPLGDASKLTSVGKERGTHNDIRGIACNNVGTARDFVEISVVGWGMTSATEQKAYELLLDAKVPVATRAKMVINDIHPELKGFKFGVRNDATLIKNGVNALHKGLALAA